MEATYQNSQMGQYAALLKSTDDNNKTINDFRELLKDPNLPLSKANEYLQIMNTLTQMNYQIYASIEQQVLADISQKDMFNIGYACELTRKALKDEKKFARALSLLPELIKVIVSGEITKLPEIILSLLNLT